jgi:putative membrane protein
MLSDGRQGAFCFSTNYIFRKKDLFLRLIPNPLIMKHLVLPVLIAAATLAACDSTHTENTTANDTAVVVPADSSMTSTPAATAPAGTVADMDRDWAMKSADGGMMEVQSSELAMKMSSNQAVKDFAKMMIDDHTKANNELKSLAATKGISLPATLGPEHKAKYDELAAKKGADFDKAYVATMDMDHQKTVQSFKDYSQNGTDADMKGWASKTLPTLEHHAMMVKDMQAKMK